MKAPVNKYIFEGTRYVIVGVLIYLLDLLVYTISISISSNQLVLGNVCGRLAGALAGFVLHKKWTFAGEQSFNWRVQFAFYTLLLVWNIVFSSFLLILITSHFPTGPYIGRIIVDVFMILSSFLLSKHGIFR